MASPYPNNVAWIQDGEPVSAGVAGRPDRTLGERTGYLKDRLDAAELGEALVAHGVTVDPAVVAGNPVYWHAGNQRFQAALAAVAEDPASHALVLADSADVVGVVQHKLTANSADVVLAGKAAIDLTAAAGPDAPAGRYYLSGAVAGALVVQKPPVTIPVLYHDGDGTCYVLPSSRDALEAHIHYRFDLVCAPAGTHSDPGSPNRHVIALPDPLLPGWLPAGHASFAGRAPAGAVWGYNLAGHTALQRVFPPIPVASAVLFWDRGTADTGGTLVPAGPGGLAIVDRNGIWWLSDCYGDVPWPDNYDSRHPPAGLATTTPPTCPRPAGMRLVLSYTVMLFATDKTVVTSLQPAPNSPIKVLGCDGQPAKTGDLELDLDLSFLTDDDNVAGARVFKSLEGLTFKRGFVVEQLRAGANVTLTPSVGTAAAAQGTVIIDVDTDLTERDLAPQIVRLDDTKERFHLDVPFIGFPPGRASAVRLRFNVPALGVPTNPRVTLRLLLYATAAGTLPPLAVTARRLPRPPGAGVVTLPAADAPVAVNTNITIGTGQYLEVQAAALPVAAGDTLLVTIERTSPDGYSGEVGLIRAGGILAAGGP